MSIANVVIIDGLIKKKLINLSRITCIMDLKSEDPFIYTLIYVLGAVFPFHGWRQSFIE